MKRHWRAVSCAVGASGLLAGVLAVSSASAASAQAQSGLGLHGTNTCTGATAKPGVLTGTFWDVTVRGICNIDAGSVYVRHDLRVAPGGALIADFGLNDLTKTGHSNLVVHGNLIVERHGALLLGCENRTFYAYGVAFQPFTCADETNQNAPTLQSHDVVNGSLLGLGAEAVVVHNSLVRKDARLLGGGGGLNCNPFPPFGTFPFSHNSDFEDNTIRGNLSVTGLRSCWLGIFRDKVGGNETVSWNKMANTGADEVLSSHIRGNLTCRHNSPEIQFWDSGGHPNRVAGHASGQCGFNVVEPSPDPAAGVPNTKTVYMHISVRWPAGRS
jgi:hypothetical protein